MVKISNTNRILLLDVKGYLYDAGFNSDLYIIDDFNNSREYVEVFFLTNTAVDYILKDLEKSDYGGLLEIKKYRHKDGVMSAIITYLED